jgi:CubicO group peptidase (beta-lactamase class C family)
VAQQSIESRIDSLVSAEMRKQKIPGVSLAVIRNGRVAILKSYGFANVEHQVRVKPETVFQSGSIGKQFTAAAVMILVEEGRFRLMTKSRSFSRTRRQRGATSLCGISLRKPQAWVTTRPK